MSDRAGWNVAIHLASTLREIRSYFGASIPKAMKGQIDARLSDYDRAHSDRFPGTGCIVVPDAPATDKPATNGEWWALHLPNGSAYTVRKPVYDAWVEMAATIERLESEKDAMIAIVGELRAEIERLEQKAKDAWDDSNDLALARLAGENKRLREALERYGLHEANCPAMPVWDDGPVLDSKCVCGLSAALGKEGDA